MILAAQHILTSKHPELTYAIIAISFALSVVLTMFVYGLLISVARLQKQVDELEQRCS